MRRKYLIGILILTILLIPFILAPGGIHLTEELHLGPVGAPAFSPDQIPGLEFWYDFSDSSTLYQDASCSTGVTADGDPIGCITDKSGNGWDAVQATVARKPTYRTDVIGGNSVGDFDGTDDSLSAGIVSPNISQPVTAFAVFAPDALGVGIADTVFNADGRFALLLNNDNYYMVAPTWWKITAASTNWVVFTTLFNGASSKAWIAGVEYSGNAGTNAISTMTLGAKAPATEVLDGHLAALLVYSRELSASERQQVQSYLSDHFWGLPGVPILWVDTANGMYQDSGCSTPVSSDGDPIGCWQDNSGNSYHLTQPTAAAKPTYKTNIINGYAVARFDGTDDWLIGHQTAELLTGSYTLFIVTAISSSADNYTPWFCQGNNTGWGTRSVLLRELACMPAVSSAADIGVLDHSTNLNDNTWRILTTRHTSGASGGEEIFVNGSNEDSRDSAGAPQGTDDGWNVGRDKTSRWFWGDIVEMLIISGALLDTDKATIESDLSSKYNISLSWAPRDYYLVQRHKQALASWLVPTPFVRGDYYACRRVYIAATQR